MQQQNKITKNKKWPKKLQERKGPDTIMPTIYNKNSEARIVLTFDFDFSEESKTESNLVGSAEELCERVARKELQSSRSPGLSKCIFGTCGKAFQANF